MFRVEAFVDDKRLSQLLHAMAGVIIGEPKIQPVANGKVDKGKVVGANSGNVGEMFLTYVKQHKLTVVGATEMREFTKSIGAANSSYSHFTGKLKELGILKKKGMKGNAVFYNVVVPK